jgi:uncharacterized protein YbjT (DUF2867 family)
MTEITRDERTTLVLGGTGKTGRRIADRLSARGLPVRVGSRSGQPPFDWADRSTWTPVLQGVRAVYIPYPDMVVPEPTKVTRAFAEHAIEQGVTRLVLLTGRGEDEAQRAEREVQDTGADVTVVRCSWFMQIFSEDFLLDPVLAGELMLPTHDGQVDPFVDVDDIADVAAAALTEPGHAGQVYELTGPRLLSFSDAVAEITRASGRDVRFTPVAPEDFAAGLTAEAVPGEVVDMLLYLFDTVLDGRNATMSDGVGRVLGRPARDFADYARDAAGAGAWPPPAPPAASASSAASSEAATASNPAVLR